MRRWQFVRNPASGSVAEPNANTSFAANTDPNARTVSDAYTDANANTNSVSLGFCFMAGEFFRERCQLQRVSFSHFGRAV